MSLVILLHILHWSWILKEEKIQEINESLNYSTLAPELVNKIEKETKHISSFVTYKEIQETLNKEKIISRSKLLLYLKQKSLVSQAIQIKEAQVSAIFGLFKLSLLLFIFCCLFKFFL